MGLSRHVVLTASGFEYTENQSFEQTPRNVTAPNVYESINAFVHIAAEIRYMMRKTSHFNFAPKGLS